MSEHVIEVIEIKEIKPHDNADKLELIPIYGWTCCVGKGDFKPGSKAVYVPPDYICDTTRPEFAFLKKKEGKDRERITVRRFRGILSQGLLIPLPKFLADKKVGDNVIEELGIVRYEPPPPKQQGAHLFKGDNVPGPSLGYLPKFDVENFQRWHEVFEEDEPIILTEKLHGASSKFVYAKETENDEFKQFVGSRSNWKMEDPRCPWWKSFHANPGIGEWCKANPEKVLFGEVFGRIQNLHYNSADGEIFFAAFAVLEKHAWLDYQAMIDSLDAFKVPHAPLVYRGPFNKQQALDLAEGNSHWPGANHMMEGVVIRPEKERYHHGLGRVILKMVSSKYLMS